MAITPLAYIATSGSGTGYAAWTSGSNVIVPVVNWTSSAGPAGTKWWMSPNYNENTGPFLIAKVEPTRNVPVGPWTWTVNAAPVAGSCGNGEIIYGQGVGFRDATTTILISENTWELRPFTELPPTGQITLLPLAGAPGTSITYQINSASLSAGVWTLSVAYQSGTNIAGSAVAGRQIAIVNSLGQTPNSGGSVHFWRLNTANNLNITNLAKAAGLPGSYNDGVGVRAAALATSNYWVSWVNWPL